MSNLKTITQTSKPLMGKKVLVVGLGLNGGEVGTVKWLVERGAIITVTDLKTEKELEFSIRELKKYKIKYVLGKHDIRDFLNSELIIKNPGVPDNLKEINEARRKGIPVRLRDNIFMEMNPLPVIGITGTKGKTTTTLLIAKMLEAGGWKVWVIGNIQGVNSLLVLDKILSTKRTNKEIVIAEFSSWQLAGLGEEKISPKYALITNIYPDHLNRYDSMADYIADKQNIYKWQGSEGVLIIPADSAYDDFQKQAQGKVIRFDWKIVPEAIGKAFLLSGDHNLNNLAAAYYTARQMGVNDNQITKAIKDFKVVEHRMETVKIINGVTYINDTASTLPTATIAALDALRGKTVILICGGNSKNLPIEEMVEKIRKSCKTIILLKGNATSTLLNQLGDLCYGPFSDFKKAILEAKKMANKGDYILLSPGFTSFGMFKNEFDRGDQFKKIVNNL